MSSVASKNLFDLLGNDPDEEPQQPVQPIDKPPQRHGKRNVGDDAAPKPAPTTRGGGRGGRGGRRGDFTGSERAFQDQDAGRSANRGKPTDDGLRFDRHSDRLGGGRIQRGGSYDGRGARGGAGGTRARGGKDDRHSRGFQHSDSQKQADKGWGEETGTAEWNDEKAGDAQAWEEEKAGYDAFPDKPVNAEGEIPSAENGDAPAESQPEPEPEDKSVSFSDYLAQQAEKKLALGGNLTARKANEGSTSKLARGKELENEETEYFVGGGGKKARERERKEKNTLVLEHDIQAREREAGRGGRGGAGRGRGRGEFRGDSRGDRRGSGRGDGGGRGGRGGFRGGRGGPSPNVADTSAFPTLGS